MKQMTMAWIMIGLACAWLVPGTQVAAEDDADVGTWRRPAGGAMVQRGIALVPHPTTPELGDGCTAAALGDLDGDGDLDAVVGGRTFEPSTVWLNDGSGDLGPHPVTPTLVISDTFDVALGDLDLDGDLDALLGNGHDQPETVWLNDGTGGLYRHDAFDGAGNTYAVALGDLDGDDDLDMVRVDFSEGTLSTWVNDGAGRFTAHPTLPIFGYGTDPVDVELGDLDGDGDLDALVVNDIGNESVWLNDGTGALSGHGSLPAGDNLGGDLGDVDGDGDLDVVMTQSAPLVILAAPVWLNDGGANFDPHPSPYPFGPWNDREVALGDMDGDGDLDAVVVADNGRPHRLALNDGTGHFVTHDTFVGGEAYDVELGDLDGDGDLDALVADFYVGAQVWINVPAWRMYVPVVGRGG